MTPRLQEDPGGRQEVYFLLSSPAEKIPEVHYRMPFPSWKTSTNEIAAPAGRRLPLAQPPGNPFCINSILLPFFLLASWFTRVQCPSVQPLLSCWLQFGPGGDLCLTCASPPHGAEHPVTAAYAGLLPALVRASRPPVRMELFGVCFSSSTQTWETFL